MLEAEFASFIQDKGHVSVSCWLLEKYQALNISPQELGYLLLALYHARRRGPRVSVSPPETPDDPPLEAVYGETPKAGKDPWMGWALDNGWAIWAGEGDDRRVVFDPLWRKLYDLWAGEREERSEKNKAGGFPDDGFDYSKIVKELDRLRGGPSVSIREIRLIQELNLKYGWSSDFILSFFRLCAQRDLLRVNNYNPLAVGINRAGIHTLEGLAEYMSDIDWVGKKAAEIKKDFLGRYGMVTVMEREFYIKWNIVWGFSHAIIARAAEETVGAANATFKYVDVVLARWRELGVKTLEDCEEAIKARIEYYNKRDYASKAGASAANSRSRGKKAERQEDSPWYDFYFGERKPGTEEDKRD